MKKWDSSFTWLWSGVVRFRHETDTKTKPFRQPNELSSVGNSIEWNSKALKNQEKGFQILSLISYSQSIKLHDLFIRNISWFNGSIAYRFVWVCSSLPKKRGIQNLAKIWRCSFLRKYLTAEAVNYFRKRFILDVLKRPY